MSAEVIAVVLAFSGVTGPQATPVVEIASNNSRLSKALVVDNLPADKCNADGFTNSPKAWNDQKKSRERGCLRLKPGSPVKVTGLVQDELVFVLHTKVILTTGFMVVG